MSHIENKLHFVKSCSQKLLLKGRMPIKNLAKYLKYMVEMQWRAMCQQNAGRFNTLIILLVLFIWKMRFVKRKVTIIDLLLRDGELSLPMLFHGDVLRFDVSPRKPVSQFTLWRNSMLKKC